MELSGRRRKGGTSEERARPGSEPSPRESRRFGFSLASPSYLETMRVPLIRGRWLTPADSAEAPKVAVINETAAKKYWPDKDPNRQAESHFGEWRWRRASSRLGVPQGSTLSSRCGQNEFRSLNLPPVIDVAIDISTHSTCPAIKTRWQVNSPETASWDITGPAAGLASTWPGLLPRSRLRGTT